MSTSPNAADFSAGPVKIADGNLIYKKNKFLFFSSTHQIPINAIGTIRARKTWFGLGSPEVIICEFNPNAEGSTYSFRHTFSLSSSKLAALYQAIAAHGTAPAFSQALQLVVCGDKVIAPSQLPNAATELTGKNDSVWIYNDRVISDSDSIVSDLLAIPYIHFIKQSGKETIWGYARRSRAKGLSKSAYAAFKEALQKLGAPMGGDPGKTYEGKKGWFGLKFWQRQETLTVGQEGLTFEYRKGRKNESIYLPFVDMTAVVKHGKKLKIHGAQNIISRNSFSSEARDAVKACFASDLSDFKGEIMKSHFMLLGLVKLWARPKYGQIEYSSNGLLIHPSKADLKADRKREKPRLSPTMKIEMDNVRGYYRKGRKFFIAVTSGNVREVLNDDQWEGYWTFLAFQKMCGTKGLKEVIDNNRQGDMSNYMDQKEFKKHVKNYKF